MIINNFFKSSFNEKTMANRFFIVSPGFSDWVLAQQLVGL